MRIQIRDETGQEVREPFLLRLAGWSEERYFAEAPEDRICEFKDGELILHSPAAPGHQELVGFLTALLRLYVRERGLGRVLTGPATLRLREGLDKEPDVFFIRREGAIGESWVEGPADLVIEVISKGTRSYDPGEKVQDYSEHGVLEYWVVDSERRQVRVQIPAGVRFQEKGRLASQRVAGFYVELEWLWEEPLPSELSCLQKILI